MKKLSAKQPSLKIGDTIFFKWVLKVTGNDGDVLKFNATIAGAKQGNYVVDSPRITELENVEEAVHAILSSNIGAVIADLHSYRSFETNGDSQSGVNVGGYPGYAVPSGQSTMFSMNLTLVENQKGNITISPLSSLQTTGALGTKYWFVCDGLQSPPVAGKVAPYNSTAPTVTLAYNQTTTVYFGSSSEQSDGAENTPSPEMEGVFLILSGDYSDVSPYGQTIPFHATRVSQAFVTLSPESGITSSNIDVSGSKFKKNHNVDIIWRYTNGTTTALISITSDTSGDFNASFTAPASQPGYYIIIATDGINTAFATFEHL